MPIAPVIVRKPPLTRFMTLLLPLLVDMASVRDPESEDDGPRGPEGIVWYSPPDGDRHFLYTANEVSGTISALEVRAAFPAVAAVAASTARDPSRP